MTNESVKKYVEMIEAHQESIEKLQEQVKEDISDFRVSIKSLICRAKDDGLDVAALKSALKVRAIERKMEEETRVYYDQIRLALGDLAGTPLGDAAMNITVTAGELRAAAEKKRRKPADVASDVTMAG